MSLTTARALTCLAGGLALLLGACTARPMPTVSPPPTATVTPVPITPTAAEEGTDGSMSHPTPTPGPTPTIRGVADAPPPVASSLPDGWHEQFNQVNIVRPDGSRTPFKVAFYSGRTPSHEAVVTILWDYEHIYSDVWRDGIELVQVVFDPTCQFNIIGSPPRAETFSVGLHYAEGIRYSVTDCAADPDVAGWLVGFRRGAINYLFYVWVMPIEGAQDDFPFIQSILDTIRFPGQE